MAGSKEIKAALNELSEDPQERAETKHEAKYLLKAISTLETELMSEFWNRVLQRFNATSKALQSPKLSLNAAVRLTKSLCDCVSGLRERSSMFPFLSLVRSCADCEHGLPNPISNFA